MGSKLGTLQRLGRDRGSCFLDDHRHSLRDDFVDRSVVAHWCPQFLNSQKDGLLFSVTNRWLRTFHFAGYHPAWNTLSSMLASHLQAEIAPAKSAELGIWDRNQVVASRLRKVWIMRGLGQTQFIEINHRQVSYYIPVAPRRAPHPDYMKGQGHGATWPHFAAASHQVGPNADPTWGTLPNTNLHRGQKRGETRVGSMCAKVGPKLEPSGPRLTQLEPHVG